MMEQDVIKPCRYFVAKCDHIKRLYKAMDTSEWACARRHKPPQPADILQEAFTEGKVVLIFSANNCHGWHGYATMLTAPGCQHSSMNAENSAGCSEQTSEDAQEGTARCADVQYDRPDTTSWYYFRIHWEELCLKEHREQCLPLSHTKHLTQPDGSPLNQARNMQELQPNTDYLTGLTAKKRAQDEDKSTKRQAFLNPGDGVLDTADVWRHLMDKVDTMGTVMLACVFGSQRYNLHTENSDVDMFVVYAAHTRDILGLTSTPPNTIKNHEDERYDYTVHELSRYVELLLSGDPRCVETLFLHPSSIVHSHPSWQTLLQWRHHFLTRECVEKYLRDATGAKGLRLLDKWTRGDNTITMDSKLSKLCYIILRLLQNARDVCGGRLCVYRETESTDRKLLMDVRAGTIPYNTVRDHINRLRSEIEGQKEQIYPGLAQEDLRLTVERWLLKLRYDNLHTYITQCGIDG